MLFQKLLTYVGVLLIGLMFSHGAIAGNAEERLAIKGYDPVAYFTESRPMKGDPRFEYEFDDMIYRFARARHLDIFKSDPDRYLPQYGNLCTAALSKGFKVTSDPNNWLIHDGKLHLFGKPIGPGLMRQDPEGMKKRANENLPNVAHLPTPGG